MRRNGKREFSKLVLGACMLVYIVTVGFGFYVVCQCPEQLDGLLTFVGAPTAVAIGFYAWKAKCENVIKYNKQQIEKIKDAVGGDENADI